MQTIPTPLDLECSLIEGRALSPEMMQEFMEPTYCLGDLWTFVDMDCAVERLYRAQESGETIGIYADYDCDGIPGAVVLLDLFKKLGSMERVHVYIPDRHEEGYGVTTRGIDALRAKGVTLMITVDVGITALKEIEYAAAQGIEVILTDHHEPLPTLPRAYAVVHPAHGTYTNQNPCGAAVAFYLVVAFLQRYRSTYDIPEGWEKWLLDLVGFATLADMVPLIGENRMLALYGLHVLRKTRRVGLRELLMKTGTALATLTETDLTFTVAPRLNAASRMDTPLLAFELLATEDPKRAQALVSMLEEINTRRKTVVAQITKAAHKVLDHRSIGNELPDIVVVGNPEWRPAVLGLVANKLQETYTRSMFVWGEAGDGTIKGSCRMLEIHHAALLFQALPEGTVLHAGGHQAAGGFATTKDQIHFLEEALNRASTQVTHSKETTSGYHTIQLPLAAVTQRHLQVVRKFAPFGTGNEEPLFVCEQVEICGVKVFGKHKEHLELSIKDDTGSAIAFTFFVTPEQSAVCTSGAKVRICGTLEAGLRGGVRIRIREVSPY